MHRFDYIGTGEAWTPELRAKLIREVFEPAGRPTTSRLLRNGAATTATFLKRPRFPYTHFARTCISPRVATPYQFGVDTAGILRGIACRDYSQANVAPQPIYVRVQRLTPATGVGIDTILASQEVPFDLQNLDTDVSSSAVEMWEVAALNGGGVVQLTSLIVEFTFALNLGAGF